MVILGSMEPWRASASNGAGDELTSSAALLGSAILSIGLVSGILLIATGRDEAALE